MTTDELRAKFEAWCAAEMNDPQPLKGKRGNYIELDTQLAWTVWQAAHASRDAEVEALKRDAERYRWLREREDAHDGTPFICIFHGSFGHWNREYADREIDDAMAKESRK